MVLWGRVATSLLLLFGAGCVPTGPATGDAGAPAGEAKPKPTAPVAVRSAPKREGAPAPPADPPLLEAFEDAFERTELGPDWHATVPQWKIERGRLCVKDARNRPAWLRRVLPVNARIEFDATSDGPEGDLKAEFWGDGVSGATGVSYTNATSYLTIFGGWNNKFHVLARIDEHAPDRLELKVDPASDDERERPVAPGQAYRFRVERSDGRTLEWYVNDQLYFKLPDRDPLAGAGHDHFGFNNWKVPACFDNVKITPL